MITEQSRTCPLSVGVSPKINETGSSNLPILRRCQLTEGEAAHKEKGVGVCWYCALERGEKFRMETLVMNAIQDRIKASEQ